MKSKQYTYKGNNFEIITDICSGDKQKLTVNRLYKGDSYSIVVKGCQLVNEINKIVTNVKATIDYDLSNIVNPTTPPDISTMNQQLTDLGFV